jgi:hypothetical protein
MNIQKFTSYLTENTKLRPDYEYQLVNYVYGYNRCLFPNVCEFINRAFGQNAEF